MDKTALIIVDVQEDFLPPNGSLATKQGREVVPVINKLLETKKWDLVAASKDWHPKDHCSFASTHDNKQAFDTMEFKHPLGEEEIQIHTLWPDHCVQGTFGAKYDSNLDTSKINVHIQKGYLKDREYYSSFGDVWGIHQTELLNILKEYKITNVVVCGLAFDYCVLNTAIDSAKNGFKTTVVESACRSVDPLQVETVRKKMKQAGIDVVENL